MTNTGVHLCVGHQHSQFWPILARFLDYYSLFWGPIVISTIDEPRDAFRCRSSTLAAFVDSDPFHGLLLTILGSQSDFHGCLTLWCIYVAGINNHNLADSGPFRGLLHCFGGPGVISTIEEPRGAFTCRSSTPVVLADSGPFRGLLLSFGVLE